MGTWAIRRIHRGDAFIGAIAGFDLFRHTWSVGSYVFGVPRGLHGSGAWAFASFVDFVGWDGPTCTLRYDRAFRHTWTAGGPDPKDLHRRVRGFGAVTYGANFDVAVWATVVGRPCINGVHDV